MDTKINFQIKDEIRYVWITILCCWALVVNYLLFFCLYLDAYRLNLKHLKQLRQQVGSKLRCLLFCFLFLNFFLYQRAIWKGKFEFEVLSQNWHVWKIKQGIFKRHKAWCELLNMIKVSMMNIWDSFFVVLKSASEACCFATHPSKVFVGVLPWKNWKIETLWDQHSGT